MKEKYNKIITEINAAEQWLIKNKNRADIDKFMDKFQVKLKEANEVLQQLEKQLGRDMTSQEILEGVE